MKITISNSGAHIERMVDVRGNSQTVVLQLSSAPANGGLPCGSIVMTRDDALQLAHKIIAAVTPLNKQIAALELISTRYQEQCSKSPDCRYTFTGPEVDLLRRAILAGKTQ